MSMTENSAISLDIEKLGSFSRLKFKDRDDVFTFRSVYPSRVIIVSGRIHYVLLRQLVHRRVWRLESATGRSLHFRGITKSAPEDNPSGEWKKSEEKREERMRERRQDTCYSSRTLDMLEEPRSRPARDSLPSRNRVFFSPRPRNTQFTKARIRRIRIRASIGERPTTHTRQNTPALHS